MHRLSGPCDCGEQHGEQPRESRGKGSIVASYDYPDEMGAVQYRVNRHITPNGEKTFSQCRPDGAGGWISGTAGVRQVPFRLPELLAADPANLVFVVEGEKCALALHKLGLIATTARGGTGGVKQWESPEFCAPFKGRQVVALPDVDADGKGRRYAERVVAAVAPVAASVKIVDLPGLQPTGEDVVEWIERGGTAEKLLELAANPPARTGGVNSFTSFNSSSPTRTQDPSWPSGLDRAAYHGLAGRIVHRIDPHTEADPIAILVQTMAAFGNAVGRGPYFAVEASRHYPNLFLTLVGQTAKSRKGTSWAHTHRLVGLADEGWAANRIISGLSSGRGTDLRGQGPHSREGWRD